MYILKNKNKILFRNVVIYLLIYFWFYYQIASMQHLLSVLCFPTGKKICLNQLEWFKILFWFTLVFIWLICDGFDKLTSTNCDMFGNFSCLNHTQTMTWNQLLRVSQRDLTVVSLLRTNVCFLLFGLSLSWLFSAFRSAEWAFIFLRWPQAPDVSPLCLSLPIYSWNWLRVFKEVVLLNASPCV